MISLVLALLFPISLQSNSSCAVACGDDGDCQGNCYKCAKETCTNPCGNSNTCTQDSDCSGCDCVGGVCFPSNNPKFSAGAVTGIALGASVGGTIVCVVIMALVVNGCASRDHSSQGIGGIAMLYYGTICTIACSIVLCLSLVLGLGLGLGYAVSLRAQSVCEPGNSRSSDNACFNEIDDRLHKISPDMMERFYVHCLNQRMKISAPASPAVK